MPPISLLLNAWILEVPPHGHIVFRPLSSRYDPVTTPGCTFYARLINLEPLTPHILTCEGHVIGTYRSDSAGQIHDNIKLSGYCYEYLGKRVYTLERDGPHPVTIAAGYLERDV